MLQILDKNYATIEPTMPKYRALCVFTLDAANLAFKYGTVDFVFAMNEQTGQFVKCNSLAEVDEFLNAL